MNERHSSTSSSVTSAGGSHSWKVGYNEKGLYGNCYGETFDGTGVETEVRME